MGLNHMPKMPSENSGITDLATLITAVENGKVHEKGRVRPYLTQKEIQILGENYPEALRAAAEKNMIPPEMH